MYRYRHLKIKFLTLILTPIPPSDVRATRRFFVFCLAKIPFRGGGVTLGTRKRRMKLHVLHATRWMCGQLIHQSVFQENGIPSGSINCIIIFLCNACGWESAK
jgi:hypothetical protein